MRKDSLVIGEVHHVFTKSIADFVIFNNDNDFCRMQQLFKYYKVDNDLKFSGFNDLKIVQTNGFSNVFAAISKDKEQLVQIIAYCVMPTHIHLVLKQLTENGISIYMNNILNSYTRYFNISRKRKGPLWETRFKNILVETDEQLLHLTRYLHLNAVTAGLADYPEDWAYSSYLEYLGNVSEPAVICKFDDILDVEPTLYRKFVNDRISYQRELAKIKNAMID